MTKILTEDRIRNMLLSGKVATVINAIVKSPEIIPKVAKLLGNPDVDVQFTVQALKSAAVNEKSSDRAITVLVSCLGSDNANVRSGATQALGSAADNGANISAAVEGLAKLLGDPDAGVRMSAVWALWKLVINEKSSARAITTLVACLRSDNVKVRSGATQALGSAADNGANISAAVEGLAKLLEDPGAGVRLNAVRALGSAAAKGVDISAAVEGLAKLLEDPNENARRDATDALGIAAEKSYVDLPLVGTSLAEYVARVSETSSPEEVLVARREAGEIYSKIASAASKRMNNSVEMAGETLSPSIRPIMPRGWNPGMLRAQGMGRTQMQEGRRALAYG